MSFKRWLGSNNNSEYNDQEPLILSHDVEESTAASNSVNEAEDTTSVDNMRRRYNYESWDPKTTNEGSEDDDCEQVIVEEELLEIDEMPFGDGSDKIFGLENFGYTCYCNSIVQCLYYSNSFRRELLNHPRRDASIARFRKLTMPGNKPHYSVSSNNDNKETQREEENDNKNKFNLGRRTSSFFGRKKDSVDSDKEKNREDSNFESLANSTASLPPNPNSAACSSAVPNIKNSNNSSCCNIIIGIPGDPNGNIEVRKKAAISQGPIINLDHSLNDYYGKDSLYTALKDLFECVVENESKTGVVSPSFLIETLKKENELFRSTMHQDAHEFFNFLLNEAIDTLNLMLNVKNNVIQSLFEGLVTNQTKCLTCDSISSRDETFLDLSVDVTCDMDLESCLRQFSASEMLTGSNKFYCDNCYSLQEAEKRMGFKRLPKILALHLKRFKYSEEEQKNVKLFNKIRYPLYFQFENDIKTDEPETDKPKHYELYGVVLHIGGGPQHGHYIALVKTTSAGWLLFDDETVEKIDEHFVLKFFGDTPDLATAYLLFYREVDPQTYSFNQLRLQGTSDSVPAKDFTYGTNSATRISEGESKDHALCSKSSNDALNPPQPSKDSKEVQIEPQEKSSNKLKAPSFVSITRLNKKSAASTSSLLNASTNTLNENNGSVPASTTASVITKESSSFWKRDKKEKEKLDKRDKKENDKEKKEKEREEKLERSEEKKEKKEREKKEKKGRDKERDKDKEISAEKKKNRMSVSFGFKSKGNKD